MGKTLVYSWRISREMKADLEREARRQGVAVAALMDRMAQDYLETRRSARSREATEQARLHRAAAQCFGTLAGGNPRRAESARATLRKKLAARHDR